MKSAVLNIGKIVTVIAGSSAYKAKMAEFITEANNFEKITFKGNVSDKTYAKYLNQLIAEGFKVVQENFVTENYPIKGATHFSLEMSK